MYFVKIVNTKGVIDDTFTLNEEELIARMEFIFQPEKFTIKRIMLWAKNGITLGNKKTMHIKFVDIINSELGQTG